MVDDPAHYRWTSYRHNALGVIDSRITPRILYQALGQTDKSRRTTYRALFRAPLDGAATQKNGVTEKRGHVFHFAFAFAV